MPREKTVSVEITGPVAPDGGYGWFVVSAAFLAHVITHGILYSFGVLFIIIEDKYGGSKADVSWILSIATGMLYLIGPIAGFLSERLGIKLVTVFGTLLGSLGYITSMFVSNLQTLYITIGLITGCGFGMVFLGAIVIVTTYFERRRSLASGIALSGAGSGAFIFSPLIKMITATFSWNGTLLILSGIILNCLVCALIFKPITLHKVKRRLPLRISNSDRVTMEKLGLADDGIFENDAEMSFDSEDNGRLQAVTRFTNVNSEMVTQIQECSEEFADVESTVTGKMLCVNTNQCVSSDHTNYGGSNQCVQFSHKSVHPSKSFSMADRQRDGYPNTREQTERFLVDDARIESLSNDDSILCNCKIFAFCSSQINLFRSKVFVIFVSSQFLFFMGFYQPFFYIPDRAKNKGIPEELSVWVVSFIGISSIIGRIILGYIADKPSVNRMYIFQAALFVAGISTTLGPVMNSVWSLFVYAVLYGVSTGIVLSLTAVILSDLLGIGKLATAFGINNFFCGTASLIGPPLAGFLYDISGTYTLSFIVAGLFITGSGLLICLVNCVKITDGPAS